MKNFITPMRTNNIIDTITYSNCPDRKDYVLYLSTTIEDVVKYINDKITEGSAEFGNIESSTYNVHDHTITTHMANGNVKTHTFTAVGSVVSYDDNAINISPVIMER